MVNLVKELNYEWKEDDDKLISLKHISAVLNHPWKCDWVRLSGIQPTGINQHWHGDGCRIHGMKTHGLA